jgi:sulfonate transport system substrate-binding protein
VLLLLGSLSFSACAKVDEQAQATGTHAGQLTKKPGLARVRIGYQKIGSPFLLKERAQGLDKVLAESGAHVEWIEFQAGPPILEAMRGDAVDVGYVGETPPVFAQAGGVPFVYIASDPPAPASEAILVPGDSPLREVRELKGKKVAVNRGSNVHWLLVQALAQAGLLTSDIELLFLSPADARSAFDSHKVDAWVIWDPFLAAAERAGARVLRDGVGLVQNRFSYVARRAFAEQHGELVRRVLQEFATLSDWAGAHPTDAAKLLAASSGISYDALLVAERRHVYGLSPISADMIENQQQIADRFFELQIIPRAVQVADALLSRPLYGDAR